jgi:hypothetical protein
MLKTIRLFIFFLSVTFVSFSVQNVQAQSAEKRDTSYQSSFTFGIHAGVPFLMTDAQYSGYNSVPTCCPTIFGSNSVLSLFPALGVSIEYSFLDFLSFQLKPNVQQFGSKLIAEETVLVNNNGTPVPVIIDHTMENNLLGTGIDATFILKPISNLRIGAGVSIFSLMTSTFIQEEQIRDKDNFGFLGANLPNVRNRQEGDIPNVNKLPLFLTGSIGYAINVSPEFQLVPEATFNYALSSFANELIVQNKNFQTTSDGSFKVNSLRLGIALLYNPTVTEELPSLNIEKPNQDSILLAQENEKKRVEAERLEKERLEKELLAKAEKDEQDRIAKEKLEKEQLAKTERDEKERLAKEKLQNENLSKDEKDKLALEEKERLAKEKLEKEQLAKAEREEKERLAKEKLQNENLSKAEKDRLAREEKERLAKEKLEKEQLAKAEREEKERLANEKLQNENLSKAEKDRLAREEKERLAKEKLEKEQLAKAEREEKERLAREEKERLAKEKLEKEQLAKAEREEKERLAKEKLQNENLTKAEKDRLAREEKERLAKEKLEKEQLAKAELAEKERLVKAELAEKERLARDEKERLAKEKLEKEQLAKAELAEKERLAREEKERLAKEKLEKERLAKAELAEKDRLAREEKERLAKEKLEKEQLAKAEREEKERLAREEKERLAKEKLEKEQLAKAELAEKEHLAREEKERLAKEKLEKEQLAKAEREEKERLAREEKERLAKVKLEKEQLAKAESEKNALQKEQEIKAEQERKIALEKKKEEERLVAEVARLKLEQEALEAEKKKELAAKEKERLRAEKEAKQEDITVSPECNVISSKPTIVVEGIAKKHNPEKPTAAKSAIVFENIITNNTICLVATEKGKFKVPVVDASTHYGFYAQKPGYYSTSQNIPIEVVTNQQQKLPPPPVTLFKVTDMEENLLNEPIVLNNVFFKFNKPELSVKAYPELDRLAELLLSNEKVRVEIHGFISKVEYDREFNKEKRKLLSSGRAKAVSEYLKSKGVKRSSMRVADEASISIEPNPLSFDAKESAEQAMCINVLFFGK